MVTFLIVTLRAPVSKTTPAPGRGGAPERRHGAGAERPGGLRGLAPWTQPVRSQDREDASHGWRSMVV